MPIEVLVADITALHVDVIVNAANSALRGGGGVDGAIHRAAGSELLQACREIGGCPTGDARITPAFNLPSSWVVHAVGPVWTGGEHGEATLLENCYRRSFELAIQKQAKSIAFPAISTGVYGYPKRQAAAIAIQAMRGASEKVGRVVACCFTDEDSVNYHYSLSLLERRRDR